MKSYQSTVAKHRRLTILRYLKDSPEYTSNGSLLLDTCNGVGISSTGDQVVGEIRWLSENGLVTYEDHGGFVVVTATARGIEIAQGIARHDGVKRPSPGV